MLVVVGGALPQYGRLKTLLCCLHFLLCKDVKEFGQGKKPLDFSG